MRELGPDGQTLPQVWSEIRECGLADELAPFHAVLVVSNEVVMRDQGGLLVDMVMLPLMMEEVVILLLEGWVTEEGRTLTLERSRIVLKFSIFLKSLIAAEVTSSLKSPAASSSKRSILAYRVRTSLLHWFHNFFWVLPGLWDLLISPVRRFLRSFPADRASSEGASRSRRGFVHQIEF